MQKANLAGRIVVANIVIIRLRQRNANHAGNQQADSQHVPELPDLCAVVTTRPVLGGGWMALSRSGGQGLPSTLVLQIRQVDRATLSIQLWCKLAAWSRWRNLVSDFSRSDSFTWNPIQQGTYDIRVVVKSGFRAAKRECAARPIRRRRVSWGTAPWSATWPTPWSPC